jgi:hypothetical protein
MIWNGSSLEHPARWRRMTAVCREQPASKPPQTWQIAICLATLALKLDSMKKARLRTLERIAAHSPMFARASGCPKPTAPPNRCTPVPTRRAHLTDMENSTSMAGPSIMSPAQRLWSRRAVSADVRPPMLCPPRNMGGAVP